MHGSAGADTVHVGAAGAQGTVASFPIMTAVATAMPLLGFAGEFQTVVPVVVLQCQSFSRSLGVVRIWGRDVSFFQSAGLIALRGIPLKYPVVAARVFIACASDSVSLYVLSPS